MEKPRARGVFRPFLVFGGWHQRAGERRCARTRTATTHPRTLTQTLQFLNQRYDPCVMAEFERLQVRVHTVGRRAHRRTPGLSQQKYSRSGYYRVLAARAAVSGGSAESTQRCVDTPGVSISVPACYYGNTLPWNKPQRFCRDSPALRSAFFVEAVSSTVSFRRSRNHGASRYWRTPRSHEPSRRLVEKKKPLARENRPFPHPSSEGDPRKPGPVAAGAGPTSL